MNWQTIRILLIHELRMLLRDRRTVILAIALPLFLMPLILYAIRSISESREKKLEEIIYKYAVTGTEATKAQALIVKAQVSLQKEIGKKQDEKDSLSGFKLKEMPVKDPAASLAKQEIHFYLKAVSGKEADALPKPGEKKKSGETSDEESKSNRQILAEPARLPGVPLILIYFQGDRDASQQGASKMHELLRKAGREGRDTLLREHGFSADPARVIPVEDRSLATAGQVTGSRIGRGLTLFLVILILTGGSVASMDIIAGEKERGSLETILTTAVKRTEVVAAKQLTILAVALTVTFIQIAEILAFVTCKLIPLPKDFVIEAPPITIVTLLFLFIPVAAFISAVLLMVSAYSKSYKEAQLYFLPVYLVSWAPALAGVLPGISLRSAIVVVPLANVSVAVREIMVGKFDWPMIFIVFAAMTAAAVWTVRAAARMLNQERLITVSESDAADLSGGPALFPKRVLRWYALLAVIMFVVAANVPQLATFRRQLLFNELLLFLGGSLLMIRWYRLDIGQAWALRLPNAAVWPAVALLIPSANIVVVGVFRLVNLIIPVPTEMLEQFARSIMPKEILPWQMILFLAILPGICEEIAFRGTLLYGLRHRFRPAVLAVVVGIIFGFFHVSYFRIIPVGVLGIVLTALALLTGSILPGMVLHIGNNAFSYVMSLQGSRLAGMGWWVYLVAAVVFAFCFYIIYRNRTPYPGLRTPIR
jgi:ABC-type Na+ efflux pump permease subunit/membrane protease YdiL (CAAX protease family)